MLDTDALANQVSWYSDRMAVPSGPVTASTEAERAMFDFDNDLDLYIGVNHIIKDEYTNTYKKRNVNGEHPSTGRLYCENSRAYETAATRHGLSVAQACVLGRLASPRGMGELAEELGCDASNITQIIARLEARDLVLRRAHPNDRRSRQILRTPDGDALYAEFEGSFAFARAAISNLSAQEQDQLATLLRKALGAG